MSSGEFAGIDFGLGLSPPWEGFIEGMVVVLAATILFCLLMSCLGTKAVRKLVKNCLQDEVCEAARMQGQTTSEMVQDSMSETERSERLGARAKNPDFITEKGPPGTCGKGEKMLPPLLPSIRATQGTSLYPVKDLEALHVSLDGDSSSDNESLDPDDEAVLEEQAAIYGQDHSTDHPQGRDRILWSVRPPPVNTSAPPGTAAPAAPLPYVQHGRSASRIPRKDRDKLALMFPVIERDGGRVHAPVTFSKIKDLAESVKNYGVTANFTLAQLDRLATSNMTPSDWETVAKASLTSMGQYMEWRALWHEAAQTQAKVNATALTPEQRQWNFDLLTGQGQYAAAQDNYHWGAYTQISTAAIKAWKALPRKGETNNQLTKIIQGPQEPFSDFVARMTEAAGRIFGNTEQLTPLIEQLIFEQATQECRVAIAPRKNKGLQDWLRVCRELGGPLTNAGLAAAILQSHRRPLRGPHKRVCYKCGKPGHLKKDCKMPDIEKPAPVLCSRCGKGFHKAFQCRSVRDIHGKLLPPLENQRLDMSKNVRVGPRPQGPHKYGVHQVTSVMEGQEIPQDWTCVQPPTSY